MTGTTHRLVAMLAMACMNDKERGILYPRWGGIEAGATLSDEFRIMWEPESVGSDNRQLVHRCFVDSDDSRDHGCVTRALGHAEGSISFIRDWIADHTGWTEDQFLEDLGMFLGVASHHIADLCTPVHVGHGADAKAMGFRGRKDLHRRIERDLERHASEVRLQLRPARKVKLSRGFFWRIAERAYETWYRRLADIYPHAGDGPLMAMTSDVLSQAVRHTKDVWHTVLLSTGMTDRKWSKQPLL